MAPLPDEWKILGEDEDVTFSDEDITPKKHTATQGNAIPASASGNSWHNPEFRKRILSAAILGPVVLGAVAWGGVAFYLLVLLCAVLMMREWDAMTQHRTSRIWGGLGVCYVTITALSLILLREPTLGGHLTLILYLLAVVWATDIGAYFSGRALGGPKLAPRISPKKTWAGLLGGILSAVAIGSLLSIFFPYPPHLAYAALLSALLAIVAQIGDLFESWLKRKADVKDSGILIPGHGGILDRVDGLTFTAPLLVAAYYLYLHNLAEATPL
jgi:phosphatidate cytidylyltransferase